MTELEKAAQNVPTEEQASYRVQLQAKAARFEGYLKAHPSAPNAPHWKRQIEDINRALAAIQPRGVAEVKK